jgi:hypothetical protein
LWSKLQWWNRLESIGWFLIVSEIISWFILVQGPPGM